MSVFRKHTPKRRNITTDVPAYGNHRTDLKKDFKDRCGYCNDIDNWRFIWFEIDHFIPKKRNKIQFLTIKTETDYSNLVYSCRSCNNAKRNKWPTNNENTPNDGDKGFIDPCDDEYKKQFERNIAGRILSKTDLGDWMYNAMKLYKPQHEIIWNIEQLHVLIKELRELVVKMPDENKLKDRLILSYNEYDDYIQKLFKH
jgi:hypothetical protein